MSVFKFGQFLLLVCVYLYVSPTLASISHKNDVSTNSNSYLGTSNRVPSIDPVQFWESVDEFNDIRARDGLAQSSSLHLKQNACDLSSSSCSLAGYASGIAQEMTAAGGGCAHPGDRYAFHVVPGSEARRDKDVLIFFQGGGACWSAQSCSSSLYTSTMDASRASFLQKGVLDSKDSRNPFKDYTKVHISYCTGDIHLGTKEMAYDSTSTIRHLGAVNAKTALDYLKENIPSPQRVVVSGCSAGNLGGQVWIDYILQTLYPGDAIDKRFIGDSYVPLTTTAFKMHEIWGDAPSYFRDTIQAQWKVDPSAIFSQAMTLHPNTNFALINSQADRVQELFYVVSHTSPITSEQFTDMMFSKLAGFACEHPNFRLFALEGSDHCFLPLARMFITQGGQGVSLVEFMKTFLNEPSTPVQSDICIDVYKALMQCTSRCIPPPNPSKGIGIGSAIGIVMGLIIVTTMVGMSVWLWRRHKSRVDDAPIMGDTALVGVSGHGFSPSSSSSS